MKWLVLSILTLSYGACGNCDASAGRDNATSYISAPSFRQARRGDTPDSCTTNSGNPGTCLSRFNCMRQAGTVNGYCGTYGVCCETNLACNQVSKLKRTIIKSPAMLTTATDTCRYTFEPYSTNVCQLLIQFEKFELQQPTLITDALTLECGDYFEVGNFKLCGDNTGQHLYMPFNVAAGIERISLTFYLPNRWSGSNWNLVVTQLECPAVRRRSNALTLTPFIRYNGLDDLRKIFSAHNSDLDLLAPAGCDQYYTEASGNVKSFNFQDGAGTLYMQNLNYVICFKQVAGATEIMYTVRKFSLSNGNPNPDSNGVDADCHSDIITPFRKEDYLMIPQSTWYNQPDYQGTYYCGTSLPERQMLQALPPFIMYFKSDDQTDATETGFSIDYRISSVLAG